MKMKLAFFLGAFLAVSVAGCDGDDGAGVGGQAGNAGSAGSGGTAGTGGSGGSGGGTGGSVALSCDDYCATLATNCTGDQSQFGGDAECKAVCANYPVGMAADTSGNSLGCRTYHGGTPASMDPGTHCPHAGPLGGGACGDDCDNFCDLAIAICGDQATPPYTDKDACLTACMGFPDTMTVPYNAAATAGDSLACRMYHLTVASTSADNLNTHCPHVAADSAPCQ
ncbi:MAG: hypothetical protein IPK82_39600 [Polyangiaceae bacterium]|nr:hypothetical protein [Polyangiaceae bacterium]